MAIQTVQAIINGVTTDLSYNSGTGKWEATVNAPAVSSFNQPDNRFNVTLKAVNTAGTQKTIDKTDGQFGEILALRVYERIKPVITISGFDDAYITTSSPSVAFALTDNDSGIDLSTLTLTVDDNEAQAGEISSEPASNGYNCVYTPSTGLSEGSHTIKINVSDNDGNSADEKSVTFKIDTVPPTLNITSPSNGFVTNSSSVTVTGTTNDTTSSPVTVEIKLNNESLGNAEVQANGSFSFPVTLNVGENTITVTATDSAGKSSTSAITVTYDSTVPVFSSVSLTPNPVDAGKTLIIEVSVN